MKPQPTQPKNFSQSMESYNVGYEKGRADMLKEVIEKIDNYCDIACYKENFNTKMICSICKDIISKIECQPKRDFAISNLADPRKRKQAILEEKK